VCDSPGQEAHRPYSAQVDSRRPLTAHAQVRPRVSLCEIYDEKSGNGTGVSSGSSVFSAITISTWLHTRIIWGINNRPAGGRSSETQSRLIDMKLHKRTLGRKLGSLSATRHLEDLGVRVVKFLVFNIFNYRMFSSGYPASGCFKIAPFYPRVN
jgi:hypothetical protein